MSDENKEDGNSPPTSRSELSRVGSEEDSGSNDRASQTERRLPTRDDCVRRLDHLSGLVLMGIVPPARANAARGCYQSILNSLPESPADGGGPVYDENMLQVLRQQPELLNLFKPLLPLEQINQILHGFRDDQ